LFNINSLVLGLYSPLMILRFFRNSVSYIVRVGGKCIFVFSAFSIDVVISSLTTFSIPVMVASIMNVR